MTKVGGYLVEDSTGKYTEFKYRIKCTDGWRKVAARFYGPLSVKTLTWCWCSCPYFKYHCEVALASKGSSAVVQSNGQRPRFTNPKMLPKVCKHVYLLFTLAAKDSKKKEQLKKAKEKNPKASKKKEAIKKAADKKRAEQKKKAKEREQKRRASIEEQRQIRKDALEAKTQAAAEKRAEQKAQQLDKRNARVAEQRTKIAENRSAHRGVKGWAGDKKK